MHESKTQPGKKFGSVWRRNKFDSYHGPEQPSGNEENTKAESQDVGTDKRAAHVHYSHDHDGGSHKVTKTFEDGSQHQSVHSSAAKAYEEGGDKAWTNVKREEHPDQQGARSEEMNYVNPNTSL